MAVPSDTLHALIEKKLRFSVGALNMALQDIDRKDRRAAITHLSEARNAEREARTIAMELWEMQEMPAIQNIQGKITIVIRRFNEMFPDHYPKR
jgi:hypothetical protein